MKVSCLRNFLKDLPDDMEVVIPGFDHSFTEASRLETLDVLCHKKWISEYGGEDLEGDDIVKTVVVID